MVDREVGGDTACPGSKVARRLKSLACPVDAPQSFHCQVLGQTGIANDARNPCVDVALVIPNQCLESIDLTTYESPEQIHDVSGTGTSSTLYYVAGSGRLQLFSTHLRHEIQYRPATRDSGWCVGCGRITGNSEVNWSIVVNRRG